MTVYVLTEAVDGQDGVTVLGVADSPDMAMAGAEEAGEMPGRSAVWKPDGLGWSWDGYHVEPYEVWE